MNINPCNRANVNFGWSCETHKEIMDTALKDFPEFHKYRDIFNDYVQRPDHDDIGFLANKHFYFGEDKLDISKKEKTETQDNKTNSTTETIKKVASTATSGGLAKVFTKMFKTDSFLDYNGENNAKAAYDYHTNEIFYAAEEGDIRSAIENAARASHFLQDMSQPQHAEDTTAIGKATDLKVHTDFESFVTDRNEILRKNYFLNAYDPEKPQEDKSFTQIFDETYHYTKQFGEITSKNKDKWEEISQQEFNSAVEGTKGMLRNLSKLLGLS